MTAKFRNHCQKHDYQRLLRASDKLLDAWAFSFGLRDSIWLPKLGRFELSRDGVLAYMILPDTELEKIRSKADLEKMGSKLRNSLELGKDGPQH